MNKLLVLFALFFVSRFLFLANYPHFYDSPEYVELAQKPYLEAVAGAHESVHPVYLGLVRLFQVLIPGESVSALSLVSGLFGLFGVVSFYVLVVKWRGEGTAFRAALPLIFFPHLWLLQTNVGHEAVGHGLFMLGLLALSGAITGRGRRWFLAAGLALGLGIADYVGMVIWLPLVVAYGFACGGYRGLRIGVMVSVLGVGLGLAGLVGVLGVAGVGVTDRLGVLLAGQGGLLIELTGVAGVLRAIRNGMVVLTGGYSWGAVIAIVMALVMVIRKKKWELLGFMVVFGISYLVSMSFWHGGMYGRLGGLIGYLAALSFGLIERRSVYWLLVVLVVVSFLPVGFAYRKKPLPLIQQEMIERLPGDGYELILSDYQRPQLEKRYPEAYYVNAETLFEIEVMMEKMASVGGGVYMSEVARSFPYRQYDGQLSHLLPGRVGARGWLEEAWKDRGWEVAEKSDEYPGLTLYRVY